MGWCDIKRFVLVDLYGMVVIATLQFIRSQKMDEFDAIHALIFAGVWTIVAAIREQRP